MLWVNVGFEGRGDTNIFVHLQSSKHIQNQFNSYMIALSGKFSYHCLQGWKIETKMKYILKLSYLVSGKGGAKLCTRERVWNRTVILKH